MGPRHLEGTRVSLRLGVKGAWDPQRKQVRVHRPWGWQSGPPTDSGQKWDLDTFGQFLWLFRPRNINAAFSLCFLIVTGFVPRSVWDDRAPRGVGRGSSRGFGFCDQSSAGAWYQGSRVSPTAPDQGLNLFPIPRFVTIRHGLLRAHGCCCSRWWAPGEGQKRCWHLPPSLKGQCGGGRDITGNDRTWSGSSRGRASPAWSLVTEAQLVLRAQVLTKAESSSRPFS